MLVVDASCLFEVVADTPRAAVRAARLARDTDQAAPHGWDAFYVALAEAFGATLLTMDERLSRTHSPTCRIEVVTAGA